MRILLRTALVALATLLSLSVNAATPPAATAPATAPVAAAPAAPVSGAARTLDRADVEAWLDGFMPYAIRRGNIAGAVVTVVKDGEVLVARGYGYADVEAKKPVDPATTMF